MSRPKATVPRVRDFTPGVAHVGLALVLLLAAAPIPPAVAGVELREVRQFETSPAGVSRPAAVAFWPSSQTFCVLPAADEPGQATSMPLFNFLGDAAAPSDLGIPVAGREVAYDPAGRQLVTFDDRANEVATTEGLTWTAGGTTRRALLPQLGLIDAAGIAVDPSSRTLFVLDRRSRRIAAVPAAAWIPPGSATQPVSWIALAGLAASDLRGLAFDASARRFDVLDAGARVIREIDERGAPVRSLGIGEAGLRDPQRLVRAPSGDLTDPAATSHLYVTDAGMPTEPTSAQVVELAAPAAVSTAAASAPSSLVQTIDTSRWSPPSPDPSGLAYEPGRNRLLMSDGEVDEMNIYDGANYYESTLGGSLLRTSNTLGFSHEPVGLTFQTGRNFFSDDDQRKVWQVALGSDNQFGTGDAVTASFGTTSFGNGDPEGLAYDAAGDRLFIADGVNSEIYEVVANDSVFGNGNDTIRHFDTSGLGASDPEAVEFNPDTGTLYTIGSGDSTIVEVTPSGALVSETDVSYLPLIHAAGLAYAPNSTDPTRKSLYIADRRQDNGDNSNENDGAIYEVTASPGGTPPAGDVRVAAASDDAEERPSGAVDLSSGDLELVTDTSAQTVGVRFAGLGVPAGATITNAYIQFVADESHSGATTLSIKAQAADNGPTFTTAGFNVSSRPRTTAATSWSPPAWTAGNAGPAQRTPDLTAVVQEVVSRSGWASGNAMAFIVTGTGRRTAVAFNTSPARAPVLHVDFTEGGPPPANQPPGVNAGSDQTITLPAAAALDGTVSDDGRPNATPTTAWSKVSGPGTVTFSDPAAVDTQASFSTAGTYVLRLTANDGALTTTDDVTIIVQPATPATGTVERRVAAGTDDAEEKPSGSVDTTSTDLELVADPGLQTVGIRFSALAIPPGATITSAYVQFVADEAQSGATALSINAEAADNAATFARTTRNLSSRPRTGAAVSWTPPAWTVGAVGAAQRTPDLTAVVQEVVRRPGWSSGNALVLVVTGSGHRTAESFEGNATRAPLLHVEFG